MRGSISTLVYVTCDIGVSAMAIGEVQYAVTVNPCEDDGGVPGMSRGICDGNIAYGTRVLEGFGLGGPADPGNVVVFAQILMPTGVDVRDARIGGGSPDWIEAPAFTGRWYRVAWVDLIGIGFFNEHVCALCYAQFVWPAPLGSFFFPGRSAKDRPVDHTFGVDRSDPHWYRRLHGLSQDASSGGPSLVSPVLLRPTGQGNVSRPLRPPDRPGI